ncbi:MULTISPECIES: phage tail protein [unclassified Deinococcus]|jgi:microcystin-dependent protein|uniref:phage tail protein n=1 Tax=unclassified Deinococcus TaxID=2623546 RepID=UPI000C182696|nr:MULTISPECIES: tail fiber protein [unclassified Deinococcus]MBX8465251.1 tail fiber protein [Deinococcus sp. RIT780]MCD0162486.1 phage tail protein [Deinococcus sp. 6YEL10]MCD0170374.1 phage tail protein [Deinococcus sp. 23YEL01]PIG96204.1 phage tail protein [Deinococcus sp. UR1]
MAQPFVGEIRLFAGNFAPNGWEFCDGRLLSIAENDVLFALIGTTYGGDGQQTFALPDLRGRTPVHMGQGPGLSRYTIGQQGGSETVTLTAAQMPSHTHAPAAFSGAATLTSPQNAVLASPTSGELYLDDTPASALNPGAAQPTGGSQPHENTPPYLTLSFIISLFGIFPSPS